MNALEARLADALHQEADEVRVSDTDLDRIETEFKAAVNRQPWRHFARGRRWQISVACAAAVAVAAAVTGGLALSSDDPEPAHPAGAPASDQPLVPPGLVGLWRNVPESPWLWEFSADGRMGYTQTSSGYLSGDLVAGTITRRVGDRYSAFIPAESCSTDYQIRETPAGAVVTVLGGTCDGDNGDGRGDAFDLERLSPGAAGPGALLPRHAKDKAPVRLSTSLFDGTWFHPQSSTLLVIGKAYTRSSLTYIMDDDGDGATDPDRRGLISVGPDGSVRARPSAAGNDPVCAPQFTNVVTDSATMTTTGAAGGCVPTGSQQTWIKLN